jgi:uncharacterized membrane protein YciS (DUF1049 family)
MIIVNGVVLHSITTVLTFGSNSNSLTRATLSRFVNGYSIMEKIQMVGFFVQEIILSVIYIRETVRLLRLSESVQDDVQSFDDGTTNALRNANVRKTMYQLLAINVVIICMDLALLGVEFANLYLIETTLKGVVYSIKLKLEFAVLGRLVQLVRIRANSGENNSTSAENAITNSNSNSDNTHASSVDRRGTSTGLTLEKSDTSTASRMHLQTNGHVLPTAHHLPEFVDPRRISADVTHAQPSPVVRGEAGWDVCSEEERERRRRSRVGRQRESWIDHEMDRYNIG